MSLARAAALVAMVAGCAGCVSDGPVRERRPDQTRRPAPAEPPVAMLLAASQPTDSDADGLSDTIPVTVYLFADPSRFTAPYWTDGVFEFSLLDGSGAPVKRWTISGEAARAGRLVLAPGPGYAFELTLDPRELPPSRGGLFNLSGRFATLDGASVRTGGAATVRLAGAGS